MEIKILNADYSDAATIVDFQKKMALETENFQLDDKTVKQGVEAVFKDQNKGQYFLAKTQNQVIGSLLVLNEWSDWRNGYVWWIHSVYVKPKFREQKVFKKMYQFLKQKVENHNDLRGLRLYVDKTNLRAQKVYQALGMSNDHYELYEWLK